MYTIFSICAVIITAVIVYLAYNLVDTIKTTNKILSEVEETTNDINTLKNSMKNGMVGFAGALLTRMANGVSPKDTN